MKSILRFRIHYETQFGENVYICGSNKTLGEWDIKNALKL